MTYKLAHIYPQERYKHTFTFPFSSPPLPHLSLHTTGRTFASLTDSLTGVSTSGPARWPPKDPRGDWLQTTQRFEVLLKNNPLPTKRPWEVHHDDHHDE